LAFWWLWSGQLVSNLGTQVSLYGLGLWLFQLQNHLLDFAAVAIVVQVAKILALPVVGPHLQHWRRRRVMVVANGLGALGTLALATLLLTADRGGGAPSLGALLPLQGLAAAAEASLVLCFASLIPLLVPVGAARQQANGLFASSDGLVLIAAPFLGAWLVGIAGLRGVLVLDGLSFGLALACVLLAPWPQAALGPASVPSRHAPARAERSWAQAPIRFGRDLAALWRDRSLRRLALLGTAMAFVYGATEVLFPAWVITALGNGRLGGALVVGGLAYGLGLRLWLALPPRLWGRALASLLVIQSLALMGAGLVVFEGLIPLWYAGLGCFTLALPVCLAIVQSHWQQLVPVAELPRLLSVRYSLEWLARLAAFSGSALVVDTLLGPALAWPHWPNWLTDALGTGPGRPMAVALGALGWVLVLSLASQAVQPPGLGWPRRGRP
jgi:MFS family permease